MKSVLIAFWGFFLTTGVLAQSTQAPAAAQAPYLVNPGIPLFRLLKVDSIQYVTKDDIKKNRKELMIFFSPECEHCKHQMRDILGDFEKFKDIEIVMATYQPFSEMKAFYEYFRLADHPNIHMGRDEKYFFPPYYRMGSLPFIVLYDKKQNLITHFEGNQKIETILNAYNVKDK